MSFRLACHALAALLVSAAVALPASAQTMVRVLTPKGPIDLMLTDSETPNTVTNFLGYVRRNQYDGSFFHRLARDDQRENFVLQGGGFSWNDAAAPKLTPIATQTPVINEYDSSRPNRRGTVAMAKLGGNPNSATSQWFVNLKDNTNILSEANNGGFTVFGRVSKPSIDVVELLAAYTVVGATGCGTAFGGTSSAAAALGELPVSPRPTACEDVNASNLAMVISVRELPLPSALSGSNRVFNYLEAAFPQYAAPASMTSTSDSGLGYVFRYYPTSNAYLGTKEDQVWYLGPASSNSIISLGSVADWLAVAAAAGY